AAVAAKPTVAAPPLAAAGGPLDAREPASMMALLASVDAPAQIASHDAENVILKATSPAGSFAVQFGGCNPQGHLCKAVQFDAVADARTATIAEINSFNQSSLTCRLYQDRTGKPHVLYSSLVFASASRQDMLTHVGAWRACLSDFSGFLKDPPGYLASAP
ncbi:MAG: hypothetical protein JWP73_379, partial [Phenylobacterium sp.]|nr:hypothetical protein [Phenylobacterium sp.]